MRPSTLSQLIASASFGICMGHSAAQPMAASAPHTGPRTPQAMAPVRVCMPDVYLPPYLNADAARPGILFRLVEDSAHSLGLAISVTTQPVARCREEARKGNIDVTFAPPAPVNLEIFDFPRKLGRLDANRRVVHLQVTVVRRSGTAPSWDGQRFTPSSGLNMSTRRGYALVIGRLKDLGQTVDDGATSAQQVLGKLARGRNDLAFLFKPEFEATQREFAAGSFEVLPEPFFETDFYLAISLEAPPALRDQAEAWWTLIGRMRNLPAYQPE